MSYFIFAILGLLAHLLIKLEKARHKENFNYKDFFADEIISLVLSFIAIFIFIDVQDNIFKYFKLPENVSIFLQNSSVYAFIIGYFGGSILRNLISIINKYLKKKK